MKTIPLTRGMVAQVSILVVLLVLTRFERDLCGLYFYSH